MIAEFYLDEDRPIRLANKIHEKESSRFSNKPLELNFNNESLNTINHFYRDDFSAFGYEIVDESNKKHVAVKINEETKALYSSEKVNAVSQWREKTLILLKSKLIDRIATLDLELRKKSRYLTKDKTTDDIKDIPFSDTDDVFNDVLLRLSCLKDILNLTNYPLSSRNCAEQLQRLLTIINEYRERIYGPAQ